MTALAGFDPATTIHTSPLFTVGEKYEYGGKTYRYYKAIDIAWVVGDALQLSKTAGCATADRSGGTAGPLSCCGIACAAVAIGSYGFVQTGGLGDNDLLTDGNVAATHMLALNASVDGGVLPGTAALIANHFGVALAADDSITLDAGDYRLYID